MGRKCYASMCGVTGASAAPSCDFSDAFTDTDGVALSTHNAAWEGATDWVIVTWSAPNQVYYNNTPASIACAALASGCDNHYAQAVVVVRGTGRGVVCRMASNAATADHYHWVNMNGGVYGELSKIVATVKTDLSTPDASWLDNGPTIKISAVGSTIKGFLNGSQKASVTDTAIPSGLYVGMNGKNGAPYDTFDAGTAT